MRPASGPSPSPQDLLGICHSKALPSTLASSYPLAPDLLSLLWTLLYGQDIIALGVQPKVTVTSCLLFTNIVAAVGSSPL